MEKVWQQVEEFRSKHESTKTGELPVDVFSLVELDLRLDVIPFDDLTAKFQVEAALRADFTGIYVDAETYHDFESGADWKLKRLRFSLAHELGHYVLHRQVPQTKHFATLLDFANWTQNYGGQKYTLEQEANEFAGRLLVPVQRLKDYYVEFTSKMDASLLSFLRAPFAEHAATKFGVNSQVVSVRLDREGIWPAG
jgi:hypothetical protein